MTQQIPLGKPSAYPSKYDPSLLFPVERKEKRDELGIQGTPFKGADIWTAYELSWLNLKGKPQVAIAEFEFAANTPSLIESKSFKLYLNSFNQERIEQTALLERMSHDLSAAAQGPVGITLFTLNEYAQKGIGQLTGSCIDELDIACDTFEYNPELLKLATKSNHLQETVDESLHSHLLKSNCLITSQPDWASVQIDYEGAPIDHASLLQYLVSFRSHNEFHEQCVERIYTDIISRCNPTRLTVMARYTRRGGLDINPWRSNWAKSLESQRLVRQ